MKKIKEFLGMLKDLPHHPNVFEISLAIGAVGGVIVGVAFIVLFGILRVHER